MIFEDTALECPDCGGAVGLFDDGETLACLQFECDWATEATDGADPNDA